MKILIVGSGGREHAIAWKIAQNKLVDEIFCAPGNGGTAVEKKCKNISITDIKDLLDFALKEQIDLTIVGPEKPLIEGIVDKFREKGLAIFGPSSKAAMLEGSKIYSKEFMSKYGVKTAEYRDFHDREEALEYLKLCGYPIVIKADGLAAGKGVVICEDYSQAMATIDNFMVKDIFEGAGKRVVVEEFLEGPEASILAITDGNNITPFISSKDHKQIYDGGKGPNTGGMGAIAPNPYCNAEVLEAFKKDIMFPTLEGIKQEKLDYVGIVFFGIIITKKGPYLLEYNVRMGDPETQAILPLMKSDLIDLFYSALDGKLSDFDLRWDKGACCCVVASSKGYPGSYDTGFQISGLNKSHNIFVAGVKLESSSFKTAGGRVLCSYGIGNNIEEAVQVSYNNLNKISFNGMYFRNDIGR